MSIFYFFFALCAIFKCSFDSFILLVKLWLLLVQAENAVLNFVAIGQIASMIIYQKDVCHFINFLRMQRGIYYFFLAHDFTLKCW